MKEILVIVLSVIFVVAIGIVLVLLFFVPQRDTRTNDSPNQQVQDEDIQENNDEQEQVEGTSNTINVTIRNYVYSPSTVVIKPGDTVTWTNQDSVQHDIAGDGDFKGPLLRRGQTFSYTFTEVGTYDYICTPHPYMTGTVVVEE
ncbi:hypothetical protein CVU76_01405 [Candidatus Dojkabacteria bacterium HGW-Dojkabacteria-1]|uniref:Blue (type 1) copper domain-containing protein n=1 Tax=Candidatus Dojkabacteria bacterium HGW-Dojkabacteria-1 TaxID=2013761 RepID=A0A2N2F3C3_9BACT|nr:MAG: hypothetical protein CVU76_01405 [Candidatus Dojkabacteria bacterium HGW-Dojkabacteria-1]